MALSEQVKDILGPGGRLATKWPDYEHRPGQLIMAEAVAFAFDNMDVSVVEAGTGTGKTLAYLLPALLSGKKTIVSTGTKNLQEQIYHKDIPFIRDRLGSGFRSAYLKGRENYLCLHFFLDFIREPTFASAGEAVYLERLKQWADETDTGDRAELIDFPEDFLTWTDISAPGDRCLGGKCPEYQDCFLVRARRKAAAADLVVVNHHLFMADLAVRVGGFGEVIPKYDAVVFDEAHHLEDVVTQHFGLVVSSWRLARLKRDVEKELVSNRRLTPALAQALQVLGHRADVLSRDFITRDDEVEIWADDDADQDRLREFGAKISKDLTALSGALADAAKGDEDIDNLSRRAKTIGDEFIFILEASDSDYVYWAERRGRGLFLRASPVDVAPLMQEHLYTEPMPLVFTSATLTTRGTFDYYKDRMGLMPEIDGVAVESPFDYEKQAVLYVPRSFPYPGSDSFLPRLTDEIECLLHASRGRAFVLFTSYRNLNHVSRALADKLPWPVLVQGDGPRHALLEKFKNDTDSVLMATHSFWQGVDVPGESLSAVIIDKLPFPRPDRPLTRARGERLRSEGGDPFTQYHVPEAVITLKQGLGRLIRTGSDRGLLAVLDSRLVKKGYGKMFMESLPPAVLTHDLSTIQEFFASDGLS